MQVRIGWSGEVEPNRWAKVDVTLEELDLRRVLREHEVYAEPTVTLAYQLMSAEGEILLTSKLVQRFGMSVGEGKDRIEKLRTTRDTILGRIRALDEAIVDEAIQKMNGRMVVTPEEGP